MSVLRSYKYPVSRKVFSFWRRALVTQEKPPVTKDLTRHDTRSGLRRVIVYAMMHVLFLGQDEFLSHVAIHVATDKSVFTSPTDLEEELALGTTGREQCNDTTSTFGTQHA